MLIGEGPGREEDVQGMPFVGRAGKLLMQAIVAAGYKRKQVTITNIVKCRPPGNGTPRDSEMDACSLYLNRELEHYAPSHILCLGNIAALRVIKRAGVTSFRGEWFEAQGRRFMATYHPAYVLRQATRSQVSRDFFSDVEIFLKEAIA